MRNHEDFSSPLGLINFYGSIDYPPRDDEWRFLGSLQPELSELEGHDGTHLLTVKENQHDQHQESGGSSDHESSMVRYLRVEMTGQEYNENSLYCTLTRISVYGSSMHQVMRDISMDLFTPAASQNQAKTKEPSMTTNIDWTNKRADSSERETLSGTNESC